MQIFDEILNTDNINFYLTYASIITFSIFILLGLSFLFQLYLNYKTKKKSANTKTSNKNAKQSTHTGTLSNKKTAQAKSVKTETISDAETTPTTYTKIMGKKKFDTYKVTELFNCFLSSIFLYSLCIIRYCFFKRMDSVISSLWVIFSLIFCGITIKIAGIFVKTKIQNTKKEKPKQPFSKNLVLVFFTLLDNIILLLVTTMASSLIAAQIPIVDITKFFGIMTNRFTLMDLPFIVSGIFVFSSNLSITLQRFLFNLNLTKAMHENVTDIIKVFIPLIITLSLSLCIDVNYTLIIVLCLGILSKYITEKFSTILFRNTSKKYSNIIPSSREILSVLAPISNTLFSGMLDIAIVTALVFTCINYGGFYAVIISSLGLLSSVIFTSNTDIISKSSDTYKYISRTVLNVACFYIFFETLEFIYKTSVRINIFTPNVIIGLFTSGIFIIFNMLKLVNLTRYINMNTSRAYIAIRSAIYILLSCLCIYYLLPYINYEILASVVIGIILSTTILTIISLNALDIFSRIIKAKQLSASKQLNKDIKDGTVSFNATPVSNTISVLKDYILPLMNDIATVMIVITLLLLPLIK